MQFKRIKKLVINLCNSLKKSEMVSATGYKGQLIWLIADDAGKEKKYNGITSEFE